MPDAHMAIESQHVILLENILHQAITLVLAERAPKPQNPMNMMNNNII